jgi:peptidoglycan/xylan/chitin deacetylase (PgdA/CDA1 family)
MSLATVIKKSIQWTSYTSGASTFWAKRHSRMRIIQFHAIGDDDYPVEVFEAQLKFIKKHLSIVTLESLAQKIANGSETACNDIALTFDDGLRNHYTIVYPILKNLGIPATFFVCPGLIESRGWLWNQEASVRLRLLAPERRAAVCRELQAPPGNVESIVAWMKTLGRAARKSAEEAICAMTPGFKPTAKDQEQYGTITWEDLADMDPSLVSIGSHTMSHPILTTLNPGDLSYEIRESRRWLEERLQRPVNHFCYPDGAYDEAVRNCVRKCYGVAVTSRKGDIAPADDLHSLRRVPVEPEVPSLAWRLHEPAGVKGTCDRLKSYIDWRQ